MKKSILLTLPLAAGLFTISGAAHALSADECKVSDGSIEETQLEQCSTITIDTTDVQGDYTLKKAITIIGDGTHKIKGTITIQDADVKLDTIDLYIDQSLDAAKELIKVEGKSALTITDSKIYNGTEDNAETYLGGAIGIGLHGDGSTINISKTKIQAKTAISSSASNQVVTINDSTLDGRNALQFAGEIWGTGNNTITVSKSNITGYAKDSASGAIVLDGQTGSTINITSDSVVKNDFSQGGSIQEDLFLVGAENTSGNSIYVADSELTNAGTNGSVVYNYNKTTGNSFVAYNSLSDAKNVVAEGQFVVTFEYYNGQTDEDGKPVISVTDVAVDENGVIDKSVIPTASLEGYTFTGWYTEEGIITSTPFNFDTEISADTVLVAGFTDAAGNVVTTPETPGAETPGAGDDGTLPPNTADSIALYATIATVALLGLGATAFIAKKARR